MGVAGYSNAIQARDPRFRPGMNWLLDCRQSVSTRTSNARDETDFSIVAEQMVNPISHPLQRKIAAVTADR